MAFKIASLDTIFDRFLKTFKRFPIAVIVAIFSTTLWMITIDMDDDGLQYDLIRAALACMLAMPALVAVKTYGEHKQIPIAGIWGLKILVIALVTIFWFTVQDIEGYKYPVIFFLLFLATHLMVAFAPWVGGDKEGFWQYNKHLFLRILIAVIYSGVLFAGLSIAILAVDQLFDANIDEDTYLRLFFFIAGIFNTIFFLSGVPDDYEALETATTYPRGLKVFTQYVLLPLVFIYLLILYAYMAKILIQAEWPVGWVSILVLCFSIAGIFSFLLIYPLRNEQEEKWISVFNRWFYFALIPLTAMLYVAIFKRLLQYGFTEERYFVLLLAIWLTGIVAYFLISKKDDIRVIPISLFILTLLGVFTAFPIARTSQLNRFEAMLAKYDLLEDGKIKMGEKNSDFTMEKDLSSILDFLDDREDIHHIQPYLIFNIDSLESSAGETRRGSRRLGPKVMRELGMVYRSQYSREPFGGTDFTSHTYFGPSIDTFNVAGFDKMRRLYFAENIPGDEFEPNMLFESGGQYVISYQGKKLPVDLTAIGLNLVDENSQGAVVAQEQMTMDLENEDLMVRLFFIDLRFEKHNGGYLENISGNVWILVKKKE